MVQIGTRTGKTTKKGKREVVCDKEMRMPPLKLRIVFKMHKRRLFNVH